jgi:hypothetical protein
MGKVVMPAVYHSLVDLVTACVDTSDVLAAFGLPVKLLLSGSGAIGGVAGGGGGGGGGGGQRRAPPQSPP